MEENPWGMVEIEGMLLNSIMCEKSRKIEDSYVRFLICLVSERFLRRIFLMVC